MHITTNPKLHSALLLSHLCKNAGEICRTCCVLQQLPWVNLRTRHNRGGLYDGGRKSAVRTGTLLGGEDAKLNICMSQAQIYLKFIGQSVTSGKVLAMWIKQLYPAHYNFSVLRNLYCYYLLLMSILLVTSCHEYCKTPRCGGDVPLHGPQSALLLVVESHGHGINTVDGWENHSWRRSREEDESAAHEESNYK